MLSSLVKDLTPSPRVVYPQIVATRGTIPSTQVTTSNTLAECRILVTNGSQPCSDIQLAFPGFYVDSAGAGEINMINSVTWQGAVEQISPSKAVRASLRGNIDIVIQPGSGINLTDPVGLDFAAYEQFRVQVGQLIAAGTDYYLASANLNVNGVAADCYRAPLTVSQIGTAGTWVATSRSNNQNVGASPLVIGRPYQNYVSIILLGDSIMATRDDLNGDAFGNHGYARGLQTGTPDGNPIPYANLARSGEKVVTIVNGQATNRLAMLRYCSHVIMNHGTNDIAVDAASFATMQTRYLAAWARIKRRGVSLHQVLVLPRTDASNVPLSAFVNGGIRDQVNAWIKTQIGVTIDGVIDPSPYIADPTDSSKWSNISLAPDGIHPSDAGWALLSTPITNAVRAFNMNNIPTRVG